MRTIDERLDFYKSTQNYVKELSDDDDSIMVLAYNKVNNDVFMSLGGDWRLLSMILSTPDYLVTDDDINKETVLEFKMCILNIALNLCSKNDEFLNKLYSVLSNIKETKKYSSDEYNEFALEFNEKQQLFHHRYKHQHHKENTFGWITIAEVCTDNEFKAFESYLNSKPHEKLNVGFVKKSFNEFKKFISNLNEYGFFITHK